MKQLISLILLTVVYVGQACAQTTPASPKLYLDIHHMLSGKVKFADVSAAHKKDIAIQNKYNVSFIKYWVDEKRGMVYCLCTAPDTSSILQTHKEAHGLMPSEILSVKEGKAGLEKKGMNYFIDIHEMGAGKVTVADVAAAHEKDLKVQHKYGVNCINYWVDEKRGMIICLSQANKAEDMINTHREAHGLIPAYIALVKQGQ